MHYDFGKHRAVARPDAAFKYWEILYIFENLYTPGIALIKISILLFYSRIFPGLSFRKILYGLGTAILLWEVCCQFTTIFECSPIEYFWRNRATTQGSCIDVQGFLIGQAVPNIVTDVVILIIPLPLVWRLQLPVIQRVGLTWILTLGGL